MTGRPLATFVDTTPECFGCTVILSGEPYPAGRYGFEQADISFGDDGMLSNLDYPDSVPIAGPFNQAIEVANWLGILGYSIVWS